MTWPTLHQENKTYCLKSLKKLSVYNHAVWEEEKGVTFPFLVVPRSFFALKSHRNACFASYRGTDYVQQKKQYNQSMKPRGELYYLAPLFPLWWRYRQKDATSFFCEISTTTRKQLEVTGFFRRTSEDSQSRFVATKKWYFFWTYLLVSLMILIYFTDFNSGYPGSRCPFSIYLKWNKPCLRFE